MTLIAQITDMHIRPSGKKAYGVVDTVVPGKGHGEMDAPRLNWLKARLDEQPDRPTMIFMHHPPFPTGLQHMDSINCRNAPAMAEILSGRANIERVACGHHHRSI